MRLSAAIALVAALALVGCGEQNAASPASSSRNSSTASAARSANSSPASVDTAVKCSAPITAGHQLLLSRLYQEQPALAIFDVSDPLQATLLCTLAPAMGGRFISETKIALWIGPQLAVADLSSGVVTPTTMLPMTPTEGAFSPDGSAFAYRVGDDTNGMSVYIHAFGSDRHLYTRPPLGGHGGSSVGPQSQLLFSPDGQYLLAYDLFTGSDDPLDRFQVYRIDGSVAFKTAGAFGAWSPSGDRLYFLAASQLGGIAGDVHVWDPAGTESAVAHGLKSYFWPVVDPGGAIIVFTSYDDSGLPHLWRLQIPQGSEDELSSAVSSKPVFVSNLSIWSDEEQPCECGPGGRSAPTGRVLNHTIAGAPDAVVSYPNPGPGGDPVRLVLDVWLPLQ